MGFHLVSRQRSRAPRRAHGRYPPAALPPLATMVRTLTYLIRITTLSAADSLVSRATKRRDLVLRRYWRREDDGTYGTFPFFKRVYIYGTFFNLVTHTLSLFLSLQSSSTTRFSIENARLRKDTSAPALKVCKTTPSQHKFC